LGAGARWRTPAGPNTEIDAPRDIPDHPVVHVSRRDALAFCDWARMDLPSEAQWEFAARGGLEQQPYPWGSDRNPDGVERMNTWRSAFPGGDSSPHATTFTEPARSYPPNAYGLYNITGNVWEWTTGYFDAPGGDLRGVLRGGSYLCHEGFCRRYRTSARSGASETARSGHIGFRVVGRAHRSVR
jgi:formylglycine-generating enzyme required for sulfatase activity